MTNPLKILQSCLENYTSRQEPTKEPTLWVAYSGGLDSTVLLHMAASLAKSGNASIKAIHINHNLSLNAQHWQQHCVQQCQALGITLVVRSVHLQDDGKGLEAAARNARYAAIADEVQQDDVVLLGQHQNDQVETFFLQLLRGAGPMGLSGMAEFSVNEYGTQLLRPFLSLTKAQLHQSAVDNHWCWIEDESNQNNDFDRNYLRNDILPALKQRWGSADTAISRSIAHIQEQQQLLNECVASQLAPLTGEGQQICIASLIKHRSAWQKHIIKLWLAQQGAQQPSEKVLARILQDCINARDDAQPKVTWGHWQCCRFAGELYVLPQLVDLSGVLLAIKVNSPLQLPDDAGSYELSAVASDPQTQATLHINPDAKLEVGFGGFTQRFTPAGENHSKPLNQWFKQWQIPPWQRVRTPLLYVADELVAVGERLSQQGAEADTQKNTFILLWSKSK